MIGKTATPETEESIRKAVLELSEVEKIVELDTMYIGSERLLVHLDVNLSSIDPEKLEQSIDFIKKQVRKAVPIAYAIQVEIRKE